MTLTLSCSLSAFRISDRSNRNRCRPSKLNNHQHLFNTDRQPRSIKHAIFAGKVVKNLFPSLRHFSRAEMISSMPRNPTGSLFAVADIVKQDCRSSATSTQLLIGHSTLELGLPWHRISETSSPTSFAPRSQRSQTDSQRSMAGIFKLTPRSGTVAETIQRDFDRDNYNWKRAQ